VSGDEGAVDTEVGAGTEKAEIPKPKKTEPKKTQPKTNKRGLKVKLGLVGAAAALYVLGFATAFAVNGKSEPAKPETQLQEIQYDMHNGNTVTCLQTVGNVVGLDCDFVNAAPAGAPPAGAPPPPPPPGAPTGAPATTSPPP
jgi:hypothetical protein